MGNASVINASCYKKNSVVDDATDVAIHLPDQVTGSTIIQNDNLQQKKSSKDSSKSKKGLVKTNSNRSSFKDNAKELQKEVDNLQNQLKERTDRIQELELTIKNNNNNNLEERSEFEKKNGELESQLKTKNLNLLEVEGKYTSTRLLATKSAKGFEALGVIIQYYLKQVSLGITFLECPEKIGPGPKKLRVFLYIGIYFPSFSSILLSSSENIYLYIQKKDVSVKIRFVKITITIFNHYFCRIIFKLQPCGSCVKTPTLSHDPMFRL